MFSSFIFFFFLVFHTAEETVLHEASWWIQTVKFLMTYLNLHPSCHVKYSTWPFANTSQSCLWTVISVRLQSLPISFVSICTFPFTCTCTRSLFNFPCVDVIIKFTVILFSFCVLSFFSWHSFVLFPPPPQHEDCTHYAGWQSQFYDAVCPSCKVNPVASVLGEVIS